MNTIEVMRKALEALEHPNAGLVPHEGEWRSIQSVAITDLRAELERMEGVEPVAWMRPDSRVAEESYARIQFSRGADKPPIGTWVPLYTAPIAPAIPALTPIEIELIGELPEKTVARWAYALAAERAGVSIK